VPATNFPNSGLPGRSSPHWPWTARLRG